MPPRHFKIIRLVKLMEEQKDDDFRRALLVNYNSQFPKEGR